MEVRISEVLLYMENIASIDPPVLDNGQGHNKQIQWIGLFVSIVFVCLFDFILYVHSTIFQLCGTVLPGLNQY